MIYSIRMPVAFAQSHVSIGDMHAVSSGDSTNGVGVAVGWYAN
jgi:hypothetical protein